MKMKTKIHIAVGFVTCFAVIGAAFPAAAQEPPDLKQSNTFRPVDGQTATEPIILDFQDTALIEVIKSLSPLTGKNYFIVDPNLMQKKITIISHHPIEPEMAYVVLESLLSAHEILLVPTLDENLILVESKRQDEQKHKIYIGSDKAPLGEFDTFSTHVVHLKYANASEVQTLLTSMGSKDATVDVYQNTNTLIITDEADGLRNMFRLIEEIDIPGFNTNMTVFVMEFARAEVIGPQIEGVLSDAVVSPTGRPTPTSRIVSSRSTARPVPGVRPGAVSGSQEEVLKIVPDERLNILIVVATPGKMERVEELVVILDKPVSIEITNLHIYELLHSDAEDVEGALNSLIGTGSARRSTGSSARPGGGAAAPTQGEVFAFANQVKLTRYEQTNALLILAEAEDYRLIEQIIAELDKPQRQVHVEAIIMDVLIQDSYSLEVDQVAMTANDAFAIGSTGNLSPLFNSTLAGVADSANGLTSGMAGVSLATTLLGMNTDGGLTMGLYDTITANIGGKNVSIPFIPVLIRAMETMTDVDILSQPSLTTINNEKAEITVGQKIPTIGSRTTYREGQASGSFGFGGYSPPITREDIGVKLSVTPQIRMGDMVSLELMVEVSDMNADQVGDVNVLGPTINQTLINNTVVVGSGRIGVIGGLISETTSHSRNQIPLLGDIPLLGWLFSNKSSGRRKRDLIVLVTPRIVSEAEDLDKASSDKLVEFTSESADYLFEQGFFKKIKRKRHMRNRSRPSIERAETMAEQSLEESGS